MKVVILCGGKGTRLREETEFRPKPMLPIGGRPVLWHIMKIYANQGFKEFILCLGYKGHVIRDYFRQFQWETSDVKFTIGSPAPVVFHDDCEESGWQITLAETGEDTLTAGRIHQIKRHIGDDEHFLLTYGDGVGNVDIHACVAKHLESKSVLTMTIVHPPGRFGETACNAAGKVLAFNEKPQTEEGWINGGFFCASSQLFPYLENGNDMLLEKRPMQRLTAEGRLHAHRHEGFWQPMDTYNEFVLLNAMWAKGIAPWKTW